MYEYIKSNYVWWYNFIKPPHSIISRQIIGVSITFLMPLSLKESQPCYICTKTIDKGSHVRCVGTMEAWNYAHIECIGAFFAPLDVYLR